ncbi:hypothetical protein BC629DRAFT_312967 [Irpex lacteus]|nr:hypothetical protein BC629DRAFT_312967 [Irpex lacteus]
MPHGPPGKLRDCTTLVLKRNPLSAAPLFDGRGHLAPESGIPSHRRVGQGQIIGSPPFAPIGRYSTPLLLKQKPNPHRKYGTLLITRSVAAAVMHSPVPLCAQWNNIAWQLVHCTYLIGVRLRGVVTIEVQRLGASPMFRLTADITKVYHWTTGELEEYAFTLSISYTIR